ncbi:flagellar hook assembly protein FlgD [Vibrio sp. SS-MA-C1-2]|uniref:flagellar hook capping FlgD N-terminal domain-containing protein n=1 Tax=Vibrio sp. SS-MA-C1-2 TaxID=2908646 RepID=UPI001F422A97|nr:flagellar hook capping FlgD N-terminal domain-containing protein [Vibrio sp. SS-MA-C1-2]UJF18019.1 flagellar hook assembly protein FlgD [Vibrio sp. SS-MA-C1-2]
MQIGQDISSRVGTDANNSIQSSSTPPPTENANSADSLKNEFLTLMVAQVQNQDPLNPADGTEYVSQLAQFSQVDSTESLVTLMKNQMVMLDNMQVLTTAGLVGKDVSVRTDSFVADNESTFTGSFELTNASNTVTLELTGADGKVTTIPLGPHSKGDIPFSIDSDQYDLSGVQQIKVVLDDGQNYNPQIVMSGNVDEVSIPSSGGASMLNIAGIGEVPFYDITNFGN